MEAIETKEGAVHPVVKARCDLYKTVGILKMALPFVQDRAESEGEDGDGEWWSIYSVVEELIAKVERINDELEDAESFVDPGSKVYPWERPRPPKEASA